MQAHIESQKEIIEDHRRGLANDFSEHAELERRRAEAATRDPRGTVGAAEIRCPTQIECCWKGHHNRAAVVRGKEPALAWVYERRYWGQGQYPDRVRDLAQLVQGMGNESICSIDGSIT
jgi:hypothetical protein